MASISIYGRLTRDPEVRQVGEQSVARLSIADGDDFYAGRDAEPQPLYFDCEVWGKRGEVLPQLVGKGDRLFVTGQLRPNNYRNKDGAEVKATTVRVANFSLVESKAERERKAIGGGGAGGSYGGGYGGTPSTDEIPF